jgi:pimeloyl-ACP methyl ester carboxylesterase
MIESFDNLSIVILEKKAMKAGLIVFALWMLMGAGQASSAELPDGLPSTFDSLGPTVQQLSLSDGRQVHFIDDGVDSDLPVVFVGGLGTSVRVIRLLDFLRSMRVGLNLRMISVERNGYGQTAFDPKLAMADFSAEVEAVLAHLGIDRFALFGISGGGPYVAKIAARNPSRVLSIHMAATSPALGQPERCGAASPASVYRDLLSQPMAFFGFPKDSPMHRVAGFQDTAFEEAARAHNARGQQADPAPLDHEIGLYCAEGRIDTDEVSAPLFVYEGGADAVLDQAGSKAWQRAFPAAPIVLRAYPGEGHDVQYRHLDQILLDIAGYGDKILICKDNINSLVSAETDTQAAGTVLGLCAWTSE